MLTIPTKGFARSVQKHNVRLDVLCDWIEGSVLFDDKELSSIDVADVLIEEQVYVSEDFARQMVMNAWGELRRRRFWIGKGCAFVLDGRRIRTTGQWYDSPTQAFCIILSLAPYYDWWLGEFGHDYTEQGDLFELLTKASVEAQFGGWEVYQTGWTRTNTVNLRDIVNHTATRLGEQLVDLELWDESSARDMGLDLLCYRHFPDRRVGIPVYLMQCASGGDWKTKLKTPDLDVWNDMVHFRSNPQRAFAAPFAFSDQVFTKNCVRVRGLLLDRCRLLLAARHSEHWLPELLADRIVAWVAPRAEILLIRST
ncbi:MAG: hypothetical protein ACOC6F_01245 [bacterium]